MAINVSRYVVVVDIMHGSIIAIMYVQKGNEYSVQCTMVVCFVVRLSVMGFGGIKEAYRTNKR